MSRLFIWLLIAAIALLGVGAVIASPDSPPQPTVAQLKAQLKAKTNRIADLKDEIDAQDAQLADQNDKIATRDDTIARLRARDPLDAVTARGPDGLWNAMLAIYAEFPNLPLGTFCGYDKSSSAPGSVGLTVSSYTFYLWQNC